MFELSGALGEPRTKVPQDQVWSDRQVLPITYRQLCQVRPVARPCIVSFLLIFTLLSSMESSSLYTCTSQTKLEATCSELPEHVKSVGLRVKPVFEYHSCTFPVLLSYISHLSFQGLIILICRMEIKLYKIFQNT